MTVRPALPAERPFILERLEALGLDADEPASGTWLVAEGPAGPVGFGRVVAREGFLELCSLGVLETARSAGVGSRLVTELLALHPGREVWLATRIPAFFARFGFREEADGPPPLKAKVCRHCHGDAVLMRRPGMP